MGPSKELYKLSSFLNLYSLLFLILVLLVYSISILIYLLSLSIDNLPLFTPFVKPFFEASFW